MECSFSKHLVCIVLLVAVINGILFQNTFAIAVGSHKSGNHPPSVLVQDIQTEGVLYKSFHYAHIQNTEERHIAMASEGQALPLDKHHATTHHYTKLPRHSNTKYISRNKHLVYLSLSKTIAKVPFIIGEFNNSAEIKSTVMLL